ncbi:Nif11-like leader peptide family natural product precursor [Treponema primitia]|uniref:Nif11-like leader peptide family natural product precursor n=1 Tax=Treponema primitia TaxID=88058 RepID=UPI00397F31E3
MAMHSAIEFIDRIRRDRSFRIAGYSVNTPEQFSAWIKAAGYNFTAGEIDDAFRVILLKAADEEAAEEIKEIRQWYTLQAQGMRS